jgi:hypothetical protein
MKTVLGLRLPLTASIEALTPLSLGLLRDKGLTSGGVPPLARAGNRG